MIDLPNRVYSQGRAVRRNGAKPSGTIVIHDTEGNADFTPPDTSLDSLIHFLRTRNTPGCYHAANDSDSAALLYPWSWETWQCQVTNNWSVGMAMVSRVIDWPHMSLSFRNNLLEGNAKLAALAVKWFSEDRGIKVPIRWISRAEALNRVPGFITHGKTASTQGTDPTRRSDPFGSYWTPEISKLYLTMVGDHAGSAVVTIPSAPAPAAASTFLPLVIGGQEGHRTITEEERALRKAGYYLGIIEAEKGLTAVRGRYLCSAEQSWLNHIGWYSGAIDGDFGPMSTKAEQRWLQSIGLYAREIDGIRGEITIRGLQSALNLGLVR